MTRQIVVAASAVPAEIDKVVELKLFPEVGTPNRKLILSIVGQGNSLVGEDDNLQSNNPRFQMDPLQRMVAGLLSYIPT